MTELETVAFLDVLAAADVTPWIDGGWGVDALLGHQTREHGDLDLVIEARHEAGVLGLLLGDDVTT